MRLHLRLALPLFAVAIGATAAGTGGVLWLVGRAFDAALAQEGAQLGRIVTHVLETRQRPLDDAAAVLAFLDGDIKARLGVWSRAAVEAAAVIDLPAGRVRSAVGPALDVEDLRRIAVARPGTPRLVRLREGVAVAGLAAGPQGRTGVVAARRLDRGFAAELAALLRAGVEVTVDGRPVAAAPAADAETVPVRDAVATPGGGTVAFTMHLAARAFSSARRTALRLTVAGGGAILAAALVFYGYAVSRITGPIRDLIAAADRVAAGDLSAQLPAGAPAELGQLVRHFESMARTIRDSQDRLLHSAKLSTVGQLVAGISHELNNPLSVLLSHAEFQATRLAAGAPGEDELNVILEQARRMSRILADLRGFVRPAGEDRGDVDLNVLAREVLALVRHDATKAGVTCAAALPPKPVVANASADQLRQALLNLAVNALQAMPDGGTLTVETAPADGAAVVRLTVRDTGAGMAAADLARATEPFFSTRPGRMGLGLAICREVARRHGGRLVLDSAPGRGTAATLELPA